MHYLVYVITDARPTCDDIENTPLPFREDENGNGKWDWYQSGGRWCGLLDGHDPDEDSRNRETCSACNGDKTRRIRSHDKKKTRTVECDSCKGRGDVAKWPTSYVPYAHDSMRVGDIVFARYPAALVVDGRWVENASEVRRTKDSLPAEKWVTVVDCHR